MTLFHKGKRMNPSSLQPVPFAESYWVIPGKFLAGEHPALWGQASTTKRIQSLLRSGITVFVDLTEHLHSERQYKEQLVQEAAEYGLAVSYRSFPIRDFTAPSIETVKQILDVLDQSLSAGKGVYVHCTAGIGRTGTIVGCFLARHGTTGQAALDRLNTLRSGMPSWYRQSPEDPDQVELVRGWQEGV